ncbi:MAG TPA: hypothetical protein VFD60_01905 [Nitrososphaeraceae archaeon]|nr:hypothetical protein [Nitrososphaeraceae archaeon]
MVIKDIAHIPFATRSKIGSAENFRSLLREYYRPYKTNWYRIYDNMTILDLVPSSRRSWSFWEDQQRAIDNWVNKKGKLIDIISA